MTNKKRLEEIREAIAHQLGLTNDWMDGTYLYHLTRSKSAFSVGTMTLDDFTEIDEELLEGIFNAIKPYFIELAERVEELEEERDEWKDTAQSYYMTNQELREQNKRYREAIEKTLRVIKFNPVMSEHILRAREILNEALEGESDV